jgi:hypothetical protein
MNLFFEKYTGYQKRSKTKRVYVKQVRKDPSYLGSNNIGCADILSLGTLLKSFTYSYHG